jgi:EpsI family protein
MKMRFVSVRMIIIGAAMLGAAGLAVAMKPTDKLAAKGPRVDLERMIPKQFGGWRVDPTLIPVLPSPDLQARLNEIYDQTLARTYVNGSGERVMLSIAYGGDQGSDKTQVHRPEYCYAAQGFQIGSSVPGELASHFGQIPVRRLFAVSGARKEPITYWITIGDKATLPGLTRKLIQLRYGLTGQVPDGMLVRVSSIGPDQGTEYRLQDQFLNDMLSAVEAGDRVRLTGALGG